MAFPATRMRRLRMNPLVRQNLEETELSVRRLVAPLFIRPGRGIRQPIRSMPGQAQLSIDKAVQEARQLTRLGVRSVLLFGIPTHKDLRGSEAYASAGIVQQAAKALKKALPDLLIITDLCFCEYTSHGHCGILRRQRAVSSELVSKERPQHHSRLTAHRSLAHYELDNDATLKIIAKTAVAQARAGADIIAPSGMIDGMVRTIRQALDKHGFQDRLIMSYAAKYASAFYGPFRDAAESAPQFGHRLSYQMNPANVDEAIREVELDVQEGADIVMVKPALAYLDIIRRIKDRTHLPVAAYNVSGEYSMVKAAAQNGWIDEKKTIKEILTSIRRAGADLIITYHVKDLYGAPAGAPTLQ